MKQGRVFVTTVMLIVLTAMAQMAPKAGWVALFDGKDLTGWKKNGDEKWVAEKGTILGESTANKYGYLTTEKTYRDFDLRLKFKGEADGNSGLFLHALITGVDPEQRIAFSKSVTVTPTCVSGRGQVCIFFSFCAAKIAGLLYDS